MDKDGNAFELRRDRLTENSIPDFAGLNARQIQQLCILSGCDYLPSIRGIGLKRASKLLRQHKTVDMVVKELRSVRWADIPDDYVDQFRRAELTFLHQRVFDPRQGRAVPLHPLQDVDDEDMRFIGPYDALWSQLSGLLFIANSSRKLADEDALGIAIGNIDPLTRQLLDTFQPQHPFQVSPRRYKHSFL